MMSRPWMIRFLALAVVLFAVTLSAHPMTIKGTVAAVEKTRIQVKTGDEKPGAKPEWSLINAKTKIMRDQTTVTFAEAKITVGERVVVTVDHDDKGVMTATEIRLAAK